MRMARWTIVFSSLVLRPMSVGLELLRRDDAEFAFQEDGP